MTETVNNIENEKVNGRWTQQQHQQFLIGLKLYGRNWRKIEQLLGTRSGSQIRSHAQKFFLKLKNASVQQCSQMIQQSGSQQLEERSVISKSTTQNQSQSQFSYFFQHIIRKCKTGYNFDFWNTLIDSKRPSTLSSPPLQRHSFVAYEDQEIHGFQNQPKKKLKI